MNVSESALTALLKKVQPVEPEKLVQSPAMLFGSGGFARKICQQKAHLITARIETPKNIERLAKPESGDKWLTPDKARGIVILGSMSSEYQLNQLSALTSVDIENIDKILLPDPCLAMRGMNNPGKPVLLIEHGSGVARHHKHLKQFKAHFARMGRPVVSLCPLMLHAFPEYTACNEVFVWGGQRYIYRLAAPLLKEKAVTYIEYGFFPQSDFYYLDKQGVNHQCSLMTDRLDWVDTQHLTQLSLVKKRFLADFCYQGSDYILVPLQVPNDANILNCSRFTNGMQEFIDYIVELYAGNSRLVFKAHPKDALRNQYNYHGHKSSDLPFLHLLERATLVHGITSSTLYEAALAGVPVRVEGESLLVKHEHQLEKLFAAMVARQTPVEEQHIGGWLRKYSKFSGN